MAITINDAQRSLTFPMFLQRVQFALVSTAISVSNEASGVAQHVARLALAKNIVNSIESYVLRFAQAVITQLDLAATNIIGGNDLDVLDSSISNIISSVYNTFD